MKRIKVGNKELIIDNDKGTAKTVREIPFQKSRVTKDGEGWHVTLKVDSDDGSV